MRKLFLMLVFVLGAASAIAGFPPPPVLIEDGNQHIIADSRYENDYLWIDYEIANDPGTQIEVKSDGVIGDGIATFNLSKLLIDGGTINGRISASGYSEVEINSGIVLDYVRSGIDSVVEINGGEIGGNLHARESGVIHIKGGVFDGFMDAWHGGTIYLYGTNFMINDQSLSFGDNLRDYGVIGSQSNDYLTGIISGTLQNGTTLDNEFRVSVIFGGDIIVVPEPATLMMFLLGAGYLLRTNA